MTIDVSELAAAVEAAHADAGELRRLDGVIADDERLDDRERRRLRGRIGSFLLILERDEVDAIP